jgi:hypothetical protein
MPGRLIEAVVDNYATHKHRKVNAWLEWHPAGRSMPAFAASIAAMPVHHNLLDWLDAYLEAAAAKKV